LDEIFEILKLASHGDIMGMESVEIGHQEPLLVAMFREAVIERDSKKFEAVVSWRYQEQVDEDN